MTSFWVLDLYLAFEVPPSLPQRKRWCCAVWENVDGAPYDSSLDHGCRRQLAFQHTGMRQWWRNFQSKRAPYLASCKHSRTSAVATAEQFHSASTCWMEATLPRPTNFKYAADAIYVLKCTIMLVVMALWCCQAWFCQLAYILQFLHISMTSRHLRTMARGSSNKPALHIMWAVGTQCIVQVAVVVLC